MMKQQVDATRIQVKVILDEPGGQPYIVLSGRFSVPHRSTDVDVLAKHWLQANAHIVLPEFCVEERPVNCGRTHALDPITNRNVSAPIFDFPSLCDQFTRGEPDWGWKSRMIHQASVLLNCG